MINNEIRRLLACLVDASEENGTTLIELEDELQRLFNEKEDENEKNSLTTKTFKDKATLFVTRNELYKPCLPRKHSISILCVFYKLYTQKEYQYIDEKKFREKIANELGVKLSTATQLCLQMKYKVAYFLEKNNDYTITPNQFTTTELLLQILPYID